MSDDASAIAGLIAAWRCMPTEFEPGLDEAELGGVESRHQFRFPPDLRVCLAAAHPVGEGFPNWRTGVRTHRGGDGAPITSSLADVLSWPTDGIVFDVEQNGLWRPEFGDQPVDPADRRATATTYLRSLPRLIPVYSHRYLPEQPSTPGNPVFSVWQSDVIYYGSDLRDYLAREFNSAPRAPIRVPPWRRIPFWSELAEGS
ncbi:MAG: SMI1/KNR4 family protein [Phycisphaeraceae bacterium]|nr:SMI1/KNR4 family protein [Phycisphaeraceae bacterium]